VMIGLSFRILVFVMKALISTDFHHPILHVAFWEDNRHTHATVVHFILSKNPLAILPIFTMMKKNKKHNHDL
jgi:hypothetical protein